MIIADNISYKAGAKEILHSTSVSLQPGTFNVIMGANGAGKSTLLKLLAGSLQPATGTIQLGDKKINEYTNQQLARKRAVLSQHYSIGFPITVAEVVMMGRYPYFSIKPSANDTAICNRTMEAMQVSGFAERDYNTLSGGEAQKVQMSRVLAQIESVNKDNILFLDEPVSHLDIKYQHQLLQTAKDSCQKGTTVVAVLHDINLSLQYADHLFFMKQGRIIHDSANGRSVTVDVIKEVFDIAVTIIEHPGHARPVIIF